MFNGCGLVEMEGDHLDLSYSDPQGWPTLTPKGSLKVHTFEIGDAEAGPCLQLVIVKRIAEEPLDWKHSIDPVHHHASDQFRIVPGGEWVVAGKTMPTGGFVFQESGWIYQEHPGQVDLAWLCLLMADRRGKEATLRFAKDQATIIDAGELYGIPTGEGKAYPHPAGRSGIAAVATTDGACQRGYLFGAPGELDAQPLSVVSGLLGDAEAGPLVHVLQGAPDQTVIPACHSATEMMLVVAEGDCRIGDKVYHAGDVRIQRSDAPLPDVIAGPNGVRTAFIIADRRAQPIPVSGAAAPDWMFVGDQLLTGLDPVPGGSGGAKKRSDTPAARHLQ